MIRGFKTAFHHPTLEKSGTEEGDATVEKDGNDEDDESDESAGKSSRAGRTADRIARRESSGEF